MLLEVTTDMSKEHVGTLTLSVQTMQLPKKKKEKKTLSQGFQ